MLSYWGIQLPVSTDTKLRKWQSKKRIEQKVTTKDSFDLYNQTSLIEDPLASSPRHTVRKSVSEHKKGNSIGTIISYSKSKKFKNVLWGRVSD
ncbi:hypothetical protein ACJ2A9_13730 [Anaerobacillus sp. MEB173]|uniref:hypothetical protein n=1 Tax=Anaerobacillus sp. MEB173 TaxID=3383345 RepID=UPI003F917ADE